MTLMDTCVFISCKKKASHKGQPKILDVNNIHCSIFYGCVLEKIIGKRLF